MKSFFKKDSVSKC